jgi:hypothetical protein
MIEGSRDRNVIVRHKFPSNGKGLLGTGGGASRLPEAACRPSRGIRPAQQMGADRLRRGCLVLCTLHRSMLGSSAMTKGA